MRSSRPAAATLRRPRPQHVLAEVDAGDPGRRCGRPARGRHRPGRWPRRAPWPGCGRRRRGRSSRAAIGGPGRATARRRGGRSERGGRRTAPGRTPSVRFDCRQQRASGVVRVSDTVGVLARGGAVAEPTVDAVVVGAGPAGSTAALVLARGGARVALVDKATFGRDKACGDLVGPRALALLGVARPDAAGRTGGRRDGRGRPDRATGAPAGPSRAVPIPTTASPSPACASTRGCATRPSPPAPSR